jgi:hypothetical protein
MIHRAAALADLFHPLCGQPGLLIWLVDPVAGDGFLDGLLGVRSLHITDKSPLRRRQRRRVNRNICRRFDHADRPPGATKYRSALVGIRVRYAVVMAMERGPPGACRASGCDWAN